MVRGICISAENFVFFDPSSSEMAAISPATATTAASLSLPQLSSSPSSLSSSSSLNFKTATVGSRCVRCGVRSLENQSGHRSLDFLSNGDPISLINPNSSSSPISMAASASESGSKKFDDGFPNLFIQNAQGIRGQHVAFLASFSSPAVIFEQLSVIYALPKLFVSSFTLVLPFFPTGTSERMEDEGDVATAFTLARILSNIPASRGGPTSLVTFDIHALQERFYFGDTILPCFESGIPLLKNRLQALPDSDNISIAFPDDGAWKRFHKQLQHYPTIVCNKVRMGDKRIVRIKEGDAEGRHVVIVDDLVQSGGTLIECQKVLAAHGAAKISAYVTHGIFPKSSWKRFKLDTKGDPAEGFSYFWITDSCGLTVKEVMNKPPFEVLSLAGSIASALQTNPTGNNFWVCENLIYDLWCIVSFEAFATPELARKLYELEMSYNQRGHALAIERLAPRLAALRIEPCPYHITVGCFWKVYFVLLHSRLSKHDAQLLSSPQVMEARALWMKELQNQTNSAKTGRGDILQEEIKPSTSNCGHKWTPMYTVNDEDDVSFSDLEGDDDISSLALKSKTTTSKGTNQKGT
ncbi:hypothetical protein HID58_021248 [Brassica napus]|uniref:BSD domain-containing protein n=2 Tax=Brassica napus TaxID=3708 RepID=A0ABQ8CVW2_BRANA|nr:hypothetical protein HID58_021248 [Brassica napus]